MLSHSVACCDKASKCQLCSCHQKKGSSIKVVTNDSIGTCSSGLYYLPFRNFWHRLVRYYWYIVFFLVPFAAWKTSVHVWRGSQTKASWHSSCCSSFKLWRESSKKGSTAATQRRACCQHKLPWRDDARITATCGQEEKDLAWLTWEKSEHVICTGRTMGGPWMPDVFLSGVRGQNRLESNLDPVWRRQTSWCISCQM